VAGETVITWLFENLWITITVYKYSYIYIYTCGNCRVREQINTRISNTSLNHTEESNYLTNNVKNTIKNILFPLQIIQFAHSHKECKISNIKARNMPSESSMQHCLLENWVPTKTLTIGDPKGTKPTNT
jgi:hypothetical protein